MAEDKLQAAVVGGSGYTGGELVRLLLGHPHVELVAVTSRRYAGKPLTRLHPNLRGATALKFIAPEALPRVDVLFVALPHGTVMDQVDALLERCRWLLDLSADFRLKNPQDYVIWYGQEHPKPELLEEFVYGLPELHRERLRSARRVAVPGCTATVAILALKPLVQAFDVRLVVVDAKVGSSAGGAQAGPATHHPERSGVVRSFAPSGHRHTAEMLQELGLQALHFSPHAVELVRGISATCHVFLEGDYDERDVWQAYLRAYRQEPFIRLVKERAGLYRFPEPKLVAGTNFCDIGFAKDARGGRLVVMAAIDNLMKGAAGQAVQCMNLMCGFAEPAGLQAWALHP